VDDFEARQYPGGEVDTRGADEQREQESARTQLGDDVAAARLDAVDLHCFGHVATLKLSPCGRAGGRTESPG